MKCTTKWGKRYSEWSSAMCIAAVLILATLMTIGVRVESVAGWIVCSSRVVVLGRVRGRESRRVAGCGHCWRAGGYWLRRSWMTAAIRSEALLVAVWLSGAQGWEWLWVLPWVSWLWKGVGIAWPGLGQHPVYRGLGWVWERASGIALTGLAIGWISRQQFGQGWSLGGCVAAPRVQVEQDEGGVYNVQLEGKFTLRVDGNIEFYKRMLVIFLSLLEVEGERRGSRRTRDDRAPFVREEQLAEWVRRPQPRISQWLDYWLKQDWKRLLSQRRGEIMTLEAQRWVIETWAKFPWWPAERVREHLHSLGRRFTLSQVEQIGRESGWTLLRQVLMEVYQIGPETFRPRDGWLVQRLLAQVSESVKRLEELGGLTTEIQTELADLKALSEELQLTPVAQRRPLPWVLQVEGLLFGRWEWVGDETVRCIYCGTTDVSRKSRQPRSKRYVDEQGNIQTVAVYRYYCHNPACEYKTFTSLPPNLIPYSRWTLDHHLAALQAYEWSRSVYRCTAQLLGVDKMTAYRWVSGFGYQLLPVAALFGMVRSSGVMGVDEKYVLVPKNDKPDDKMKRWMYVYVAVDCYTYDLLHIDLYPYNSKQSAQAFLLALRAKGYHPRVIVTDMRTDYRDVVVAVFPSAVHHECIFHALQQIHEHFSDIYGKEYTRTNPQADALHQEIVHVFAAKTKRTAQRRYEQVLTQRATWIAPKPDATVIFDFLERHWPYLVNGIESQHIPTTNNAVEEVIRIFTQHYKTFCGFENVDTARLYLAVFEKVYRFTPFSEDAQERIRGKCPLELAGYEVQQLPIAHLFRGLALHWPEAAFREVVPNV